MDNMVLDLRTAPPNVRAEIEALEGDTHTEEQFNALSKSTRDWLNANANKKDTKDMINTLIKDRNKATADYIENLMRAMDSLHNVLGEEEADKELLDMHNVCAAFVRAYNVRQLEK